jgi:hypothetical protein
MLYSAIIYSVLISAWRWYIEHYRIRVLRLRQGPRAQFLYQQQFRNKDGSLPSSDQARKGMHRPRLSLCN